ncbi:MAG: hypothetical protein IJV67_02450 [Clostridia bacterium]|nr:hypothetical protein [Clostridia bacterium]
MLIDNKLYKFLKITLSIEKYYFAPISIDDLLSALNNNSYSKKDVKGAVEALITNGYLKAYDDSGNTFRIMPKAHAMVEDVKRSRKMFWIPVIISAVTLLTQLL